MTEKTLDSRQPLADAHDALVDEPEAARIINVAPGTLKAARLHHLPQNPLRDLPHVRIGRSVRYRLSDIWAWIDEHTVRRGVA